MNEPDKVQSDLVGRIAGRLEAYLALLRSEGMRIDPVQHRRVLRLLAEGLAGPDPATPERLAGQVVPILASTAHEQSTARQRFFEMFASDAPAAADAASATESVDTKTLDRRAAVQPRFLVVLIALFLAATVAIAAWLYTSIEQPPETRPEPSPSSPSVTLPRATDALANFIANYEIEELKLPEQSWSNRTWRWYYAEYDDWRKWMAVILPLAAYLAGMTLLVWLILTQLRRRRLKENMRRQALQFSTDPARMGDRSQISQLQPLRRAAEVPLRDLAPGPTIDATIAAGGLLSPRYKSRTYSTDFVALIDRRSRNDHLAAYAETFTGVLEAAGLGVERFHFRGTPLRCTSVRSRKSTDLANLIETHENAVVLVFIEELAMADPITGRARDWVARTQDATARFAVLPVARLSGRDGTFARACGFTPLECGPEGVRRLVGILLGGDMPSRAFAAEPDRHRDLIRIVEQIALRADRWTQATPPDAEDIQATLDDLARAVGRDHLRWIAGTAIYPELRWSISTHLKRLGMREAGQTGRVLDETLVAVSRLPWYRQGAMPDWVRNALIGRLRKGERTGLLTRILRALGLVPRPAGAADRLEIETRERTRQERLPRRPADRILLDFLMPRLTARSPLFVLPDSLARRLIRRPMLVLIAAGVVGAAGAGAVGYAALSEIPINECDLWAASPYDHDRVGPPRASRFIQRGGHHLRILKACKSAAQKYPDRLRYAYAQLLVERMIQRGVYGGPEVTSESFERMKKLAAIGHPAAINSVGWSYFEGIGTERDIDKSYGYFIDAARAGSITALRNAANVILNSDNPEISNLANFEDKLNEAIDGKSQRLDVFYDALQEGYDFADGSRLEKDLTRYADLVELASSRQSPLAFEELGYNHRNGIGVRSNVELARHYYEKAFEIGPSPRSALALAQIYRSGDIPDPDNRVLYMTMFAAKFGDRNAIRDVRQMFLKREIETDDANIESLISGWRALLQGNDQDAMFILGEEILEANSPESRFRKIALDLLARSAKLGHEDASQYEHLWITDGELRDMIAGTDEERMYALGQRIYTDSPEGSEREAFGIKMLKRAAELGHPYAEEEYGYLWIDTR